MFWKWKRSTEPNSDAPPLFEYKRERRATYRVNPDSERPVTLIVRDNSVVVENISAGGVALIDSGLGRESSAPAELRLPDGEGPVQITVEVVRMSEGQRHHCRFVALTEDTEDRIHRYVLEREKELIRKGKIR